MIASAPRLAVYIGLLRQRRRVLLATIPVSVLRHSDQDPCRTEQVFNQGKPAALARKGTEVEPIVEWVGSLMLPLSVKSSLLGRMPNFWSSNSIFTHDVASHRPRRFYILGVLFTICGRAICVGHAASTPSSSATVITQLGSLRNARPTKIKSACAPVGRSCTRS